ncbi:hypothetical protein GCK72_015532 [Caenorhabditis remanei]|uniref:Tyrosine-protein phosphatase domain-containing protein n=1 Tax=Caenorhabditis remanei TaxID=31234 RepID=A0A6A5GXJ0_CAERE|nr:hypothetical protein GCK72_015532 [Caenorhabditis remanei]KAF1759072.1 hypothetical protein GCK72_015532 [Caenorhabditis remanei]
MVICGLLLVHSDCAPLNHSLSSNNNSHVPSYLDAFKELIAQHVYGTNDNHNPSDSTKNDDIFDLNSSREFLRAKRNAPPPDKLKELIDKSSSLARISNGIALQSGLMDGTIKIEDAVGELLNLGTLKVSDVVGFEMDPVKQLTGKLKGLPTNLDKSVEKLEKVGLEWKTLEEMSRTVGDVTKLTKPEEYFTSLKDYEKKFNFDLFTEPINKVVNILSKLEGIEKLKIDEKTDITKLETAHLNYFIGLPGSFREAIDELTTVKNTPNLFSGVAFIMDSSKTFAPFGEMAKLIDFRLDKLDDRPSYETVEIVKKNFKQLEDLAPMFSTPHLKVLNDVIAARTRREPVKRTVTTGFVNGASDLKQLGNDVRDSWIVSLSNNLVSLKRLENGLTPVLDIKRQLAPADEALLSISSGESSMFYLDSIQKDASTSVKDSSKLAEVFNEYEKCRMLHAPIVKASSIPSQQLIAKILSVEKMFRNLKAGVQKIDTTKVKSEMDAFIKFLGFTNIKDTTKSSPQLPDVLKKIKTTDNLKKFKEFIACVKSGLDVDPAELKNITADIIAKKDTLTFVGLEQEANMHKCLHDLKEDLSKLAQMIQLTQKLRSLDSKKIQKVENAASSLGTATNELKSVNSIPDSMMKDAKEITTEINKWPESLKSSGEIGQSVALLSHANDFKTLVLSGELDKFDAPVQTQITAMKKGKEQDTIKTLWGDHNKFVTDLQASSNQIQSIGTSLKLAEIKNFEDYGTVMKTSLEAMKDVTIDVKNKVEALDTLISLPKAPAELEKIKKTLQHLGSLDLTFSSHSSHFQKVPNALKSLYDFLVKFSIEPTQAPPPRSGNAPLTGRSPVYSGSNGGSSGGNDEDRESLEREGLQERIGLGVVIGVLLLLFIILTGYKYFTKRFIKKQLREWIKAQRYPSAPTAHRHHDTCLKTIVIETEKFREEMQKQSHDYLPERKHRNPGILCNPETALHKLKKDGEKMPIHANLVKSKNGKRFIACQAPTDKSKDHDDTTEDFWHMVVKERCDNVVMLCQCVESKSIKSAQYYPVAVNKPKTCGRYEISLLAEPGIFMEFKDIIVRRMLIRDTTNKLRKRTINHYQHVGWGDQKCPPKGKHEALYQLMKKLESKWIPARFQSPVVVHCSSGIGRTMTFIGIHTVSQDVIHDASGPWTNRLNLLREARWHAIQTTRQSYWLQMAVAHKLNWDYKLGMDEDLKEQQAMFYAMAFQEQVTPELAAERQMEKDKKAEAAAKGQKYNTTQKASPILGQVVLY